MASAALATFLAPQIHFPRDFNTNFLMFVRWIHFLAGIPGSAFSISLTW